jgi:peptidoglycan/xylan/chitin deacetylase (PgdA/CDA1 family)
VVVLTKNKKLLDFFLVAALAFPTVGTFATPTHPSPAPVASISSVQLVNGHPNYLQWQVDNTGDADAWVAPYAIFYQKTSTPLGYVEANSAIGYYRTDTAGDAVNYAGYGWIDVLPHSATTVYSEAVVPANVKWVEYNAQLYSNGIFYGWLYPRWDKHADVGGQNATLEKYIIFRDDDIAPWNKVDTLKLVNQVHIDENVPVTLGIVPHPSLVKQGNVLPADAEFFDYMQSISSNPLFEFAQHGYAHRDNTGTPHSEFYGLPYSRQYETIKSGQSDLVNAFGVTPTTFIPPWNKGDDNTLKAIKSLGFTEYSSAYQDFNINSGYRDGIRIESYSFVLDDTTLPLAKDITERLLNDEHTTTIIVFYHFWSFSGKDGPINATKVQLFGEYLDYLKKRGDVVFTKLDRSYSVEGHNPADSGLNSTPTASATMPSAQEGALKETALNESAENNTIVELIEHQVYPIVSVDSPGNTISTKRIERQLYPLSLVESSQDKPPIERI